MSRKRDREIGLTSGISRRDVLHGFGAAAAASFVPGGAFADAALAAEKAGELYYPPSLTGMRGNHDGAFEVAHALAREGKRDWGPIHKTDEDYDLVVVGAGISGLSAAHFYLQDNPKARILLIDNHDDFGGHAKRNEFTVGGQRILGYGGSQSVQEPNFYPRPAKQLLRDIGIDIDELEAAYDQEWFIRHDLAAGMHFDKANWGADRVLRYELGSLSYLPLAPVDKTAAEFVSELPISDGARGEFLRLLTVEDNRVRLSGDALYEYAYSTTYREFLETKLGISEPEVFKILQDLTLDIGVGIESTPLGVAVGYNGLPGRLATGLPPFDVPEPYIHHFPDGNATVARLLVRKMIPGVAEGCTHEDVVGARFDYQQLDQARSPVRLRLNSTVIKVTHDGDPKSAKHVNIDYVTGGETHQVRAKHCILACYNSIIPSLCPELPERQRKGLAFGVKSPILYTTVVLNNWRAWKQLGIGGAIGSGTYHPISMLDFPVSFGGQEFPDDPDQPIVLHMEKFPHRANAGLSAKQQMRLGRHELLATSFETIERNVREQLASLLSGGDFDPARDIAGLTVNRWAHGYADGGYADGGVWDDNDTRPHVVGRQPFGRITIANSDAGAMAMMEAAVVQAHRAVEELS